MKEAGEEEEGAEEEGMGEVEEGWVVVVVVAGVAGEVATRQRRSVGLVGDWCGFCSSRICFCLSETES